MTPKIETVIRVLLSISLLVFGMNKFLGFIPAPPLDGTAGELLTIYQESGFMHIIGGFELLGGIGLLIKKFIGLSLTFLVAIMFNAVLFHLLYDSSGLFSALMALLIVLINVYFNRSHFSELLRA